jgi:[protein-PII] uridylyltransferase
MGDEYFVRESHLDIAWQTEALMLHADVKPLILIRESSSSRTEGATQIFIWAKDAKHVFSAATTCLAQLGLNIQDARIYQAASGYTLDTFYVLDEDFQPLGEDEVLFEKIRQALLQELALSGEYTEVVSRMVPRELKQFPIKTRCVFSNDIVGDHTVLEVTSPDRPGLLATVAHAFMENDIIVQNAKVLTLGERVEDVFFITNKLGEPLSDPALCDKLQSAICHLLDREVKKES